MPKFLVESPHQGADCNLILSQVQAMGFLHNFDWGCDSGVHSGWAIFEADNEAEARLAVPLLVRGEARVVRVVKYSPDQLGKLHPT